MLELVSELTTASNVSFVKGPHIIIQIVDVHVDAGSSSARSTRPSRHGLDNYYTLVKFPVSFPFIAVNGYFFIRIYWHHHLMLTLNDSLKELFSHRRQDVSRMRNSSQVICSYFLKSILYT